MARPRSRGRATKNPYAKADAFSVRARAEGYPARSVYKLEEIDRRCQLFRPGQRVLDLGCAPGSWLLYVAKKVGPRGTVRGIDLAPITVALPPNALFRQGDAFEMASLDAEGEPTTGADFVHEAAPYDVLLSDMAPFTTGNRLTDQARSAELVNRTLDLATELLTPRGACVAKLFMSDALPELRQRLRVLFDEERIIRPEGTRAVSYEVFLIGLGRKAL